MSLEEDIEDYLSYFSSVYEGMAVQDSQKVAKLISKLPRTYYKFMQTILYTKPNFE